MRLDDLVDRLGDTVTVTWRSFLLRTEPKTPDRERFVAYTRSWLRPAELEPRATFRVWDSDDPPPRSSLPAQIAWKVFARRRPDLERDFRRRLFSAYFADNRDISDWGRLAELADEVGDDPDAFLRDANEHQLALAEEVVADHRAAWERGITAVPTVVLDDAVAVPGAQDTDTYEALVRRYAERRAS